MKNLLLITFFAFLVLVTGLLLTTAQLPKTNPILGIDGSGTAGFLAKFLDPNTIGDSIIKELDGKVGIGTQNPAEKLEVNGSATVAGFLSVGNSIFLLPYMPGINTGSGLFLTGPRLISDYGDAVILTQIAGGQGQPLAERLRITEGANVTEAIFSNVNVGIGTTSPATKLDVNGAIRASSGSIIYSCPVAPTLGSCSATFASRCVGQLSLSATCQSFDGNCNPQNNPCSPVGRMVGL